jgi:hypothetical protein
MDVAVAYELGGEEFLGTPRAHVRPYVREYAIVAGNLDPGERVEVAGSPRSALQ